MSADDPMSADGTDPAIGNPSNQRMSLRERFPIRCESWRFRTTELRFGDEPKLMGIINVTPDSFSDGGKFLDPGAAVDQGLRLVADGADILDVGAESTRPYSEPVLWDEELRRVLPVVRALCQQTNIPVSIDTSKARVAAEAIAAGAEIINDVTGFEGDPEMVSVAVESGVGVCAMHMQGTPQTMQDHPVYGDIVSEIGVYLCQRRDALLDAGVDAARICLDPGIGFGKTHQHNLSLLAASGTFHRFGCPLLIGHSRKGFIGHVLGDKLADRTAATVGVSLALARQGIQVLRIHDVLPTKHALHLFLAAGGLQ